MTKIDLEKRKVDLASVLQLASKEPVLITGGGREFLVSLADDFDAEVAALRSSARFQAFLDERIKSKKRIPLEEIEKEITQKLTNRKGKVPQGLRERNEDSRRTSEQ